MSKVLDQIRLDLQIQLGHLARLDILSSFKGHTALILPISLIPGLIPQDMVTKMHTITLPDMEEELKKLISIITVLLQVPLVTTLVEMLLWGQVLEVLPMKLIGITNMTKILLKPREMRRESTNMS